MNNNSEAGGVETLTVKAGGWWSGLKIRVEAAKVTDDARKVDPKETNYAISRKQWDYVLKPIFEAARTHIHEPVMKRLDSVAINSGYNAMTHEQRKGFHDLLQFFQAAADPEYLESFRVRQGMEWHYTTDAEGKEIEDTSRPPTSFQVETELGKKMKLFADACNNEGIVLVTQSQLGALAAIAKGAADHAAALPLKKPREGADRQQVANYENANTMKAFWYKTVTAHPLIRYSP